MKNSDLFLELFDDDLLKPQENIISETDTAVNDGPSKESIDETFNSEVKRNTERFEFDLNATLEREKIKNSEGRLNGLDDKSLIHNGDTDSSDDEDNKNMDSYNYDAFGRDVKRLLQSNEKNDCLSGEIRRADKATSKPKRSSEKPPVNLAEPNGKQLSLPNKDTPLKSFNLYADPFFGLRIINPLISSKGIQIRMTNKAAVPLSKLKLHLSKNVEDDFVTAGVITRSLTKQSQNDNQYMIWELSDLGDDELQCLSVFLFGRSYKELWKTQVGTVVAILNPSGSNKKGNSNKDSFSISIKFPDQVMIWGQSKDYGLCKSMKKNGEKCTAYVNKSRCEFCVYHVKKEYSKFSSIRSEIQSSMGSKNMNFLRNKVLGKNEVFYGGRSFTSLKAPSDKEKVKTVNPKDQQRLSNLGITVMENKTKISSQTVSLPHAPRAAQVLRTLNMDSHILKSLSSPATSKPSSFTTSKSNCNKAFENLMTESCVSKLKPSNDVKKVPTLSDPEAEVKFKSVSTSKFDSMKELSNNKECDKGSHKEKLNSLKSNGIKKVPTLSNPESENKIKVRSGKASKFDSLTDLSGLKRSTNKDKELKNNSPNEKVDTRKLSSLDVGFNDSLKSGNVNNRSGIIIKSDKPGNKAKEKLTSKPSLSNPETEDNKSPRNVPLFPDIVEKSNEKLKPKFHSSSDNVNSKSQKNDETNPRKDLQKTFNRLFNGTIDQKAKINRTPDAVVYSEGCNTIGSNSPSAVLKKSTVEASRTDGSKPLNKSVNSSPSSFNCRTNNGFSNPATSKMSKAKARAVMFVKRNGPIAKPDPNSIKKQEDTVRKKRERSVSDEGADGKVVFSELYLQLMKQTSQQQDLVEAEKLRMEEEYFDKMGLKEQLEEKMMNTFKIDCKAVKCLQCKYIWFSAADICKAERHTLKIVDTVKRFFKCGNCGNRTVSLHIVPMFSCKNCQSSNWQRAPMMREKNVKMNELSIRGGEQQFIHSQSTNSNLNLLVPD